MKFSRSLPAFKKNKIKNIVKYTLIFLLLIAILVVVFFIIIKSKIFYKFSNLQQLKNIIKSAGFWSYSVFAILQFLQVTFIPLPASVTTIAGVIIFGPLIAFAISTLSIILGSICAYLCGKIFGVRLINHLIGPEKTKNFQKLFQKNQLVFFIMMLFPFFPDDILCLVAGLTNMNFKFFLITNLITRTIGLFFLCFLGSGQIIPFSSWGIPVWILIGFLGIVFIIIYTKNKQKIYVFLEKKTKN